MNTIKGTLIIIFLMYLVKLINYITYKIMKARNKPIQILVDITTERIKTMHGFEFEAFCQWLFEASGNYQNVEQTPYTNDEGKDLILTDNEGKRIFVECKRYDYKPQENLDESEDHVIGRVICQKLVGAMVSEGIKEGIIITTGSIHKNATDYIEKLKNNSDINIEIYTMKEITSMLAYNKLKGECYTLTV